MFTLNVNSESAVANFSDANLSGLDLSGIDVSYANFSNANLEGSIFLVRHAMEVIFPMLTLCAQT